MKRFCTIDFANAFVRFPRYNADGTISELTAAQMVTALGAGISITKVSVADRFTLTTATVQNGDYVYQTSNTTLYEVIDDTQLGVAAGYVALATVTAAQISSSTCGSAKPSTRTPTTAPISASGAGATRAPASS